MSRNEGLQNKAQVMRKCLQIQQMMKATDLRTISIQNDQILLSGYEVEEPSTVFQSRVAQKERSCFMIPHGRN